MKRGLLACFLFIIVCCKALPYSSSESTLITSKAGDHKHLAKEKQLIIKNGFGNSKVMKSKKDGDLKACKGTGVDEVLHLPKAEKGKKAIYQLKKANRGVYGGADLHPKKKGGASSSVLKSSSLALQILAIGFIFFF